MSRFLSMSFPAALVLLAGCPPEEPATCGEFDEVFAYVDADGDGYGSEEQVGWVCELKAGEIDNSADCDDTAEAVHPNAEEACDSLDNDCNGRVDDGNAFVPWYPDEDADGYGVTLDAVIACQAPDDTYIRTGNDCDDTSKDVNPGVVEICNAGVDDDCDGAADDADPGVDPTTMTRVYIDGDGDGYGDEAVFRDYCEVPKGVPGVTQAGDCADDRAVVNPGATEVCNDRDDDCDGLIDDEDASIDPATQSTFFADVDGDGYGDPLASASACRPTPGIGVANDDDCDDTDPDANLPQDWFLDTDGDGAGDGAAVVANACLNPGGGLVPEQNGVDCAPFDGAVFPLQLEDCFDGLDQNCDAAVDCADLDCFSEPTCVPPCADDALAPASLPFAIAGTTVGAGDDEQPSTCSSAGGAPDLQYWFTPPVSGAITIDMIGSVYDTTLYVLDTCNGVEFACNDDFWGLQSQVTVNLTAGVPVLIVVDGYGAGAGAFNLNFN